MRQIKGKLTNHSNLRIGIVVARFNERITRSLLEGALEMLEALGVDLDNVTVAYVPGAFELPLVAKKLTSDHDAVIALGCVIRGATPHFDYVCAQAASGVLQVSLQSEKPVIFGVLTTDTIEQAIERSGTKSGNKGADSASAAIEMMNVLQQCEQDQLSLV